MCVCVCVRACMCEIDTYTHLVLYQSIHTTKHTHTSYLDNLVSTLAGDKAVTSNNVSVDEVLLLQILAAMGHIQCHLDLLAEGQQCRTLEKRGGGGFTHAIHGRIHCLLRHLSLPP